MVQKWEWQALARAPQWCTRAYDILVRKLKEKATIPRKASAGGKREAIGGEKTSANRGVPSAGRPGQQYRPIYDQCKSVIGMIYTPFRAPPLPSPPLPLLQTTILPSETSSDRHTDCQKKRKDYTARLYDAPSTATQRTQRKA